MCIDTGLYSKTGYLQFGDNSYNIVWDYYDWTPVYGNIIYLQNM